MSNCHLSFKNSRCGYRSLPFVSSVSLPMNIYELCRGLAQLLHSADADLESRDA